MNLNQITCTDCLTELPNLQTSSIDYCFTDIPYNVGKDYEVYNDNLPQQDYLNFITKVIHQIRRVVKNNKFSLLVGQVQLLNIWKIIPNAKLVIIHQKAIGFASNNYFWSYYGLLSEAKPLRKVPDVWNDVRLTSEGYFCREKRFPHPARTSDELTDKIIAVYTNPKDIVLDPFMGVGTTAVSAKKLGRNFVGFELSPKYCIIAKDRLKNIPTKGLEKW